MSYTIATIILLVLTIAFLLTNYAVPAMFVALVTLLILVDEDRRYSRERRDAARRNHAHRR
jgi:hypothetical protein